MGYLGAFVGNRRFARLVVLGIGSLALANCSGGRQDDPRYGVSASPRVVEPGQPVPKGGGVYRVGKPYVVAGRTYVPEENINYSAVGMASWYGDDFHGRYTANGEIFDMNFDLGGASDAADAVLCAGHQSCKQQIDRRARQRSRALCRDRSSMCRSRPPSCSVSTATALRA